MSRKIRNMNKVLTNLSLALVSIFLFAIVLSLNSEVMYVKGQQASAQQNVMDRLVIAVVPQGDISEFETENEALAEYFSTKLGIDVEVFYPIDDTTTLASLKSGSTQIAFMSSRPALLAHEQNDGKVLAFMADLKPFNATGGETVNATSYMSQYWTLNDRTDINSLEDMRDKTVAFSGPLSTGGYLFPIAELVKLNLLSPGGDPMEFFSNIIFSGGYQQSLIALLNEEVDVAAGDDWAVFTFLSPEQQSQIKVLESFGPVPTHSAVYRADVVSPELIESFKQAMIDLKEENPQLLDTALFGANEYIPIDHDEHLSSLENALNITKVPHI